MSFSNLIKSALLNIKAHKLRVFLTMIGIIIGISSVITVLSIGAGLEHMVTESANQASANKYMVTYAPEGNVSTSTVFTEDDILQIEQIDGVESAESPMGYSPMGSIEIATFEYGGNSTQQILAEYKDEKLSLYSGRMFQEGEEKVVVIGGDICKTVFDSYDDAIGKGLMINGEFFEVIGVSKAQSLFGLESFGTYVPKGQIPKDKSSNDIYFIEVTVKDSSNGEEIVSQIEDVLKTNHSGLSGEFNVEDSSKSVEIFSNIIGSLTGFVAIVTGISLFVGGIGIMNIMYVSVTERKREIGIRRAIGAKPRDVMLQFLFEAIFITGIGGIIGIITGYLFASIAGAFLPFSPVLTIKIILGASATSVIVGIIFGIVPARNASKLDPIKAIYK